MGPFLDGGMIANNPTLDVLTDIHKYNTSVRGDQASPFGLVVSLGTGVPPPMHVQSFDVFKPESIWEAPNVLMGARALGELLVDQVSFVSSLKASFCVDFLLLHSSFLKQAVLNVISNPSGMAEVCPMNLV